jgi:saposin
VTGAGVDVEKCAWGESYWCSELNIAKSCGAIEHCKTTVWKNQELTSVIATFIIPLYFT